MTSQSYVDFVDKYNTCRLPHADTESELHSIVSQVQVHSKAHTKSCKPVKNKPCRYGFPKQPALRTFVASNQNVHQSDSLCENSEKEKDAKLLLMKVWNALETLDSSQCPTFSEVLSNLEITNEQYEESVNRLSQREKLVIRRAPNKRWINVYNPDLLLAWNANMDFQPVLDPYTCVCYILSYISKAEHAMSLLLETTLQEAREDNLQVKEQLKKLGSTYLTHREVSAQESAYRALSMPLKHLSREVVFIPAHKSCTRMSVPLSQLKRFDESRSDESPWMTNIVDRYYARPMHETFENMSLAEFSSLFRVCKAKSDPEKADDQKVSL